MIMSGGTPALLLDEWRQLSFLNQSSNGDTVLISGREDSNDDSALLVLEANSSGDFVELDDSPTIRNAYFTANGRDVVFTVQDSGSFIDVEIRQAPADGSERATTLYRDAFVIDIGWDAPVGVETLFLR